MRYSKKLMAMLLTYAMVLTLVISAFAADTCTITVEKASAGQTYEAYKVFTVIEDDGEYYYYADSALKAIIDGDDDAPFTTSDTASSYGYTVIRDEEAEDTDVIAWLGDNVENFGEAVDSDTPAAGSNIATLEVDKGGYYYITTTLGSDVTIDNVTDDVTLYEKNDVEPSIPDGYGKVVVDGSSSMTETSAKIGDKLSFEITFVATNYTGAGEDAKQIVEYTITDTPDDLEIIASTVVLKVGETTITVTPEIDDDGVMTITLPWVDDDGDSLYVSPIDVTLTYDATVAVEAIDGDAENTFSFTWVDEDDESPEDPVEPDEKVEITTYEAAIKKVDKNDTNTILNAEFKLYDAATEGNEILVVACKADGSLAGADDTVAYYRVAVGNTEKAAATVIKAGDSVAIKGLDEGSYYLEETKVPDGYNAPSGRFEVVFGTDTTIVIENANGTVLPTTGGMGTVLFVALGALLAVSAGVVLTAKKRMYNEG